MRWNLVFLGLFILGADAAVARPTMAAPATGSVTELAGLWMAKRWFGPYARGPLTIRRTGATYTASMVGQEDRKSVV